MRLVRHLPVPAAALLLAACMQHSAVPPDLNVATTRPTDRSTYVVAVKALSEPIRINDMHAWEIQVNSANGEPVRGARIDFDGGMPQHGHGFPTQPRVTKEIGDGRYLLEGMKFSMTGWWELKLKIQSPIGQDQVTFNTVVALPSVQGNKTP